MLDKISALGMKDGRQIVDPPRAADTLSMSLPIPATPPNYIVPDQGTSALRNRNLSRLGYVYVTEKRIQMSSPFFKPLFYRIIRI